MTETITHHLIERYWDGSQWSWNDHGNSVSGDPIVYGRGNLDSLDNAAIRVNVFIRGSNGHLLERSWDGQAWHWNDLGGAISDAPLQWIGHGNFWAVDNDQIRIRIFAQGSTGHLIEYHWNTFAWQMVDHGINFKNNVSLTGDLVTPLVQGDRTNPNVDSFRMATSRALTDGELVSYLRRRSMQTVTFEECLTFFLTVAVIIYLWMQ